MERVNTPGAFLQTTLLPGGKDAALYVRQDA